jgi:pyridoxamine 5'-phosphate oxidase
MHWQKLKPEARALWAWPPPGEEFDTTASFPKEIADNCPIPNCFEVIRIGLTEVEMLQLGENPHNRMRWREKQNWAEEKLNP